MRNAPAYAQRAHCGLQNFAEKTFTDGSETAKTAQVFSLESFPLYGMHITLHLHVWVGLTWRCWCRGPLSEIPSPRQSQWLLHRVTSQSHDCHMTTRPHDLPSSPTSSVSSVCSMILLATEIACLMLFRHPTEPTSWVTLEWTTVKH